MKGISAIVATILMLMITIAITGTAYLYVTGVFTSRTSALLTFHSAECSPSGILVYIRNDGSGVVSNVNISRDNGADSCVISSITAGGVNYCTIPSTGSVGNHQLQATSASQSISASVYCVSSGVGGGTTTTTSGGTTSTTTTTTMTTTDTTGGTTGDDYVNGYPFASPITTSASGTLQTIGVNVASGGTGHIRVAIYTDSSGSPNTLLCQSGSVALSGTGWKNVDVSSCSQSITASTAYWLALQSDTSSDRFYVSYESGSYKTQAYGAFINPFGGSSTGERPNLRMIY